MSDTLKYQDNLLLTLNDKLSTCCCNSEQETSYELIPCDGMLKSYGDVCTDVTSCVYTNRRFLSLDSKCIGSVQKICECHILYYEDWNQVLDALPDKYRILFDVTAGSGAITIVWTETYIQISGPIIGNHIYIIEYDSTLGDLDDFIWDSTSHKLHITALNDLEDSYHPNIVKPFTIVITGDTYRTSTSNHFNNGILRIYNNTSTWDPTDYEDAIITSSISLTASNIQESFNHLFGSTQVNYFSKNTTDSMFTITFTDELCGLTDFYIRIHDFANKNNQDPSITILGPEYRKFKPSGDSGPEVWYVQKDPEDYYALYGTEIEFDYYTRNKYYFTSPVKEDIYMRVMDSFYDGSTDASASGCPFETNTLQFSSDKYHQMAPMWPEKDGGIQCCPQKGDYIGPNSSVGYEVFENDNGRYPVGYAEMLQANYGDFAAIAPSRRFWNLDTNFTLGGNCYHVSPSFFMIGKEGRHRDYNYFYGKHLHSPSNCDFGNDSCDDNNGLPNNCVVELFIAKFHKDIPWGPFGSYYNGIEVDFHEAFQTPWNINSTYVISGGQSYLSTVYDERQGISYAPQGFMRTRGNWLNTEQILISVFVHRPIPFYIGTAAWDDLPYYVEVDAATVTGNLTIGGNTGCGIINFVFDCEGQTVGDFVDAINAVMIDDIDIPMFEFCLGSEDARNIPASKIINVSSELFQQWKVTGDSSFDPQSDTVYKISGSTFPAVPLTYADMHTRSALNGTHNYAFDTRWQVFDYYLEYGGSNIPYVWTYDPFYYSGDIFVIPPPYIRVLDEIWSVGGKETEDYNMSFRKTFLGDFSRTIRSPNLWWTNIPGYERNILKIIPNTGLDPFDTLTFSLGENATGQISVVGSGSYLGSGFVNTGYIETDKNGVSYSLYNFINDINNLSFTSNIDGRTYHPLKIQSSSYYFPMWIDHSTYVDGSFENPRYGPATGFNPTDIDHSFKEPLSNVDRTDLLAPGAVANINAWLRYRPGYYDDFWEDIDGRGIENIPNDFRYIPYLNYCLPPSVNVETGDIACNSTQFSANGFLVNYGCISPVCKTIWYLKTERCSANTEFGCTTGSDCGGQVPHRFNHEGDSTANANTWSSYGGILAVTQPTLYICERNIHPDCDIKWMVKVPFQITALDDFQYSVGGHTYDASTDQIWWTSGEFGAGSRYRDSDGGRAAALLQSCSDALALGLTWCPFGGGDNWILPISNLAALFCLESSSLNTQQALISNYIGWCQYIDPQNADRVKYEDIPRTWPPTAYVVGPATKPFCSTRVFNFEPALVSDGVTFFDGHSRSCLSSSILFCDEDDIDPAAGDGFDCANCYNSPICPQCINWDRMTGVHPMLSDGEDQFQYMTVLFRPIVKNITGDDYCGNGNCERWDVHCGTVCYSCIYTCEDTCNNGLRAYPVDQSVGYSESFTNEILATCGAVRSPTALPGANNCTCCDCNPYQICCSYLGPCFNGGVCSVGYNTIFNSYSCWGYIPGSNINFPSQCSHCTGGGSKNYHSSGGNGSCGNCGSSTCYIHGDPSECDENYDVEYTCSDVGIAGCQSYDNECCTEECVAYASDTCHDNFYYDYVRQIYTTECSSRHDDDCGEIACSWNSERVVQGSCAGCYQGYNCGGC